jgi:hypothetical protein
MHRCRTANECHKADLRTAIRVVTTGAPLAGADGGLESTMNADLVRTLKALPIEPARVVDLYPQLYAGTFAVPVQAGSEADLGTAAFWIYPSTDGVRELPVFTVRDPLLENVPVDTVLIAPRYSREQGSDTPNDQRLWRSVTRTVRSGSQNEPAHAGARCAQSRGEGRAPAEMR